LVQELDPKLNQHKAHFHLSCTLRKGDNIIVKSKAVVAKQTTTKRSNRALPKQYSWNMIHESSLDELYRRNTGICRINGNTFGELIRFFITGGDESNLLVSENSRFIKVSCDAGRKKHEKKTADGRSSISLYRTGCVAGDTRPTLFLMKGKTQRSDTFICNNCRGLGSTIIMTENAFMAVDGWEKMTPMPQKGFATSKHMLLRAPSGGCWRSSTVLVLTS
jgi:hypothetical protein